MLSKNNLDKHTKKTKKIAYSIKISIFLTNKLKQTSPKSNC